MLKKCSLLLLILLLIVFISNIAYASDIVMDLNTATNTVDSTSETINNTIYSDSTDSVDDTTYNPTTTVTEDYDDTGAELSISNMLNIILIVVGVVLILLGIAIILKIK